DDARAVPLRNAALRFPADAAGDLDGVLDVDVERVVDLDAVARALHTNEQAVRVLAWALPGRRADVFDRLAREEGRLEVVLRRGAVRALEETPLDEELAVRRARADAHAATGGHGRGDRERAGAQREAAPHVAAPTRTSAPRSAPT